MPTLLAMASAAGSGSSSDPDSQSSTSSCFLGAAAPPDGTSSKPPFVLPPKVESLGRASRRAQFLGKPLSGTILSALKRFFTYTSSSIRDLCFFNMGYDIHYRIESSKSSESGTRAFSPASWAGDARVRSVRQIGCMFFETAHTLTAEGVTTWKKSETRLLSIYLEIFRAFQTDICVLVQKNNFRSR